MRRKRNRHAGSVGLGPGGHVGGLGGPTSAGGVSFMFLPLIGLLTCPPGFSTRAPAQPLRAQGWIVRYEYKMACFAEFRGEEEVARKCARFVNLGVSTSPNVPFRRHFQTSWEILLDMFGSTAILPPRTKRWAEAKVIADCISVKVMRQRRDVSSSLFILIWYLLDNQIIFVSCRALSRAGTFQRAFDSFHGLQPRLGHR